MPHKEGKLKRNIIRIILILLLLWTFYIIFGFSSQDGEVSGGLSQKITQIIVNIFNIQEDENIVLRLEKIIRKIAHFSIYTVVGILLMALLSTYNMKQRNAAISTFIIGIIYASSDEIHQSFIPGRSARITDVLIDTMGVLMGILLIMIVIKVNDVHKIYIKNDKIQQNY